MASRRKEIVALLVDKLKEIDGQGVAGSNYTYKTNVFNNVFRALEQDLLQVMKSWHSYLKWLSMKERPLVSCMR